MPDTILFEQPLNERVRTLMRLEHLFNAIQNHATQDSEWDARCCITAILEATAVLSRGDLKSELMKELERFSTILASIKKSANVDTETLDSYSERIELVLSRLRKHRGQLGSQLRNDEFLNAVAQRLTIPGGSCQFDIPNYHFWLNQDPNKRLEQFNYWLQDLAVPLETVNLMLSILRGSGQNQEVIADKGCYSENLEGKVLAQIIRVEIDRECAYYPEISGNKHRFSIRFFSQNTPELNSEPTDIPVKFKLLVCRL